ncbi:MAG: phage tail tube protein [Bacilli bacterium]
MAKVTIGQYAVSECVIKVKKGAEYVTIADLEEMGISIENNTETWYSINDGGWQNALLTAKALSGSFSGKRTLGDDGNDLLDSVRYNIGKSAELDWKIEFPDDSTLEFTAVTALTDLLGAATDVAPLTGDLTGKGKPTFTPATAGN